MSLEPTNIIMSFPSPPPPPLNPIFRGVLTSNAEVPVPPILATSHLWLWTYSLRTCLIIFRKTNYITASIFQPIMNGNLSLEFVSPQINSLKFLVKPISISIIFLWNSKNETLGVEPENSEVQGGSGFDFLKIVKAIHLQSDAGHFKVIYNMTWESATQRRRKKKRKVNAPCKDPSGSLALGIL